MQEAPELADVPNDALSQPADSSAERPWWMRAWLWVAVLAALPFIGFWTYGLTDLDEGFYGSVTAEMNRRAEWITPFYNGHPWFEKPVLLYWFTKPSLMLFGGQFGLRLPGVLATLGLFAIVAWFVRRRLGDSAAQKAVLILAGSLLVVGIGRWLSVDPFLNLCLAGSLLLFWESLGGSWELRAWSGLLLGCSALAKGPVGIILFCLIVGWTYWKQPDLRPGFRGGWLGFFVLMFVAIAAWYVPAFLKDGNLFVQEFLIRQNLQRFSGGDEAHSVGVIGLLIYPLVLLIGMAPWSWFAFLKWPWKDAPPVERYLATWACVTFVLFTLSGTKLPHYILPATVPIAILAAIRLERVKSLMPFGVVIVLVGAIAQAGLTFWYGYDNAELHRIARYVRVKGGEVAAYQMPRREHGLGTLKMKVQETSHPSLPFYVGHSVLEADKLGDLIDAKKPLWVITRVGRIHDEDLRECAAIGQRLRVEPVPGAEKNYVLYLLEAASPRTARH